jgi:regulatory protein
MSTLLNYDLQIVSKKHLSEKEMLEKVIKKEDNYAAAKKVIAKLKENDLLDDKAFMQDLIAWDNERNFGQNKIVKHLKDKGIPDALINKVNFPQSIERKKAKALLDKLDRKYAKYAYESKKKHVYQALVAQGYNHDIAREVTNDLKRKNDKVEQSLLTRDYEKIKSRYEKKYEGYQLKQKIYAALVNKGYKYQEIKKVLEDFTYEDDSGF